MRLSLEMKQQTNKTETVLTKEEKKENKMHSQQIPALLYFTFKSHLHELQRI